MNKIQRLVRKVYEGKATESEYAEMKRLVKEEKKKWDREANELRVKAGLAPVK